MGRSGGSNVWVAEEFRQSGAITLLWRGTNLRDMTDRDGRGQLLLVAALGLAVAFVALALVLNAVVFTENLATQNHGRSDDAVGFQNAVQNGLGGYLSEVNEHNNSDYEELNDVLETGVGHWDSNTALLSAADGRVTNATVTDVENGTQVLQSEERAFTNESGAGDWTLAPGVEQTRRFKMVVSQNDSANPFRVVVSNATTSWTVQVADNGSNTDVQVFENGTQVASRTYASETVELDVTQGTINGTEVADWRFANGVGPPYDIAYENGDTASGRYVFVVDRPRVEMLDDLPQDTYFSRTSGDYPTTAPALYRANVSVSVVRSKLTYETLVPLAPGSPPGGEDYSIARPDPEFSTRVLFVDDDTGYLMSVSQSGSRTFDTTDVTVLGPRRVDFDGDARDEVPFVDSNGALRVIDTKNRTRTWRTNSSKYAPVTSNSLLGVGAWSDPQQAILYANDTRTGLYGAEDPSGPSTELHTSGNGVESVAGVADIDGDGKDELVFGDNSQQLRYVDDNGTEVKISNGGFGANTGVGIGTPRDFDGDGKARVPFVDGSNNLKLVDASGNVTVVIDSNTQSVDKTSVAVTDWDDDGELEIMFLSGGELYYADDVTSGGDPVKVTADLDGDGTAGVDVDTSVGLA